MANNFDPNVLFRGGEFKPVSSYFEGQRAGLAADLNRQKIAANQRTLEQEQALQGLAGAYGTDQFIPEAIAASPDIAKYIAKQQIAQKLARAKRYAGDNEWVTDPRDPAKEIYTQTTQDPNTGLPVVRIIKDDSGAPLSRIRKQAEKIQTVKDRQAIEDKQFTIVEQRKQKEFKLDEMRANLDAAKKQHELNATDASIQINYDVHKQKADAALNAIDRMVGSTDKKIKRHKGFKSLVGRKGAALGWGVFTNPVEGTDAADFKILYDKITGTAFMEAFESLKGGGQITDFEGKKATQALIEMNTSSSEKAFINAARRFQRYLKLGLKKAAKEKKIKTRGLGTSQTGAPSDADLENMTDDELNKYLGG